MHNDSPWTRDPQNRTNNFSPTTVGKVGKKITCNLSVSEKEANKQPLYSNVMYTANEWEKNDTNFMQTLTIT